MPRRVYKGRPDQSKSKKFKSRLHRRMIEARMQTLNVLLLHVYHDYARCQRQHWNGLTPVEQEFLRKRTATLGKVSNDLTRLRVKIFDDVKWW